MDIEKQTVLVVDDATENIDVVVGLLKDLYKIKAATDGVTALKIAELKLPDLILLDIMMPEMDGYEVCRKLKENEKTKEIPIIFVTAKGEVGDETKGFELGAVDFVTKPIKPEILKSRIKTHLTLSEQKIELENRYLELKQLEDMRDKLVHMVIHDLRGPLSVIQGFAELNLFKFDKNSDIKVEDIKDSLQKIHISSKNLESMISGILDVSKLESGDMKLEPVEFDPAELFNGLVDSFSEQAEKGGISFKNEIVSIETIITADKILLQRILQNLTTNAIKYTPKGSSVNFSIDKDDKYITFSVKDDGPGILPEYQEKIFDKFFQIQMKAEGGKYGVGLGLAFCKMASDALKGEIWVESEGKGKGSTFFVRLPVDS